MVALLFVQVHTSRCANCNGQNETSKLHAEQQTNGAIAVSNKRSRKMWRRASSKIVAGFKATIPTYISYRGTHQDRRGDGRRRVKPSGPAAAEPAVVDLVAGLWGRGGTPSGAWNCTPAPAAGAPAPAPGGTAAIWCNLLSPRRTRIRRLSLSISYPKDGTASNQRDAAENHRQNCAVSLTNGCVSESGNCHNCYRGS